MDNIPEMVTDEVIDVLHEKLFWNGFTMQDPIENSDFYVLDSADSDLYMYRNTMLIELVRQKNGTYEIKEYV
jgi:hypothetical protein